MIPFALLIEGQLKRRAPMLKLSEKQITEMVKEFMDMPSNMDTNVLANITAHSEGLGIRLWQLVESILISYYAHKEARVLVEGAHPHGSLPEFTKEVLGDGAERPITGEALFNSLVEVYKEELLTADGGKF